MFVQSERIGVPRTGLGLVDRMRKYRVAVCGIQEHRRVHTDVMKETVVTKMIEDYYLVTTSAWRNEAQAATGGVGLMLSRDAQKTLISVTQSSDRVITASFKGNPVLTTIVAYAPTLQAQEDEKVAFYNALRQAVEAVPQHHFLAILGDFNARLGLGDAPFTYHQVANDNGKRLIELIEDYSLLANNTQFEKRKGRLWTWLSPSGSKAQIDFILTRRKWRNSVLDSCAHNTFSTVGSDHRVVVTKVRLSLRSPCKAATGRVQYDWGKLRGDSNLQERYAIEVHNRFQVLTEDEESATCRYGKFIEANKEAADICMDKVPKVKKRAKASRDPRVVIAREEMQVAYNSLVADYSCNKQEQYASKKKALAETYDLIDEEVLFQKISEVEQAHVNQKHSLNWKLINEITGKKTSKPSQIKRDTDEQRVHAWYRHFKNLLGDAPAVLEAQEEVEQVFIDLDIEDSPFSQEGYAKALSSLKSGKACGEDGVVPEVLKHVPINDIMLDFINCA